jgi:hypothetical protein
MADFLHRFGEAFAKATPAIAIALEQVVSDALRRFLANAGQAAQRLDQLFQ